MASQIRDGREAYGAFRPGKRSQPVNRARLRVLALQQSIIMKKHGAKIELWDNVKEMFGKKKTEGSMHSFDRMQPTIPPVKASTRPLDHRLTAHMIK